MKPTSNQVTRFGVSGKSRGLFIHETVVKALKALKTTVQKLEKWRFTQAKKSQHEQNDALN